MKAISLFLVAASIALVSSRLVVYGPSALKDKFEFNSNLQKL